MNKDQYTEAMKRHGCTNKDFSILLGISESSSRSYTLGRRKVPLYVEKHIEALDQINNIKESLRNILVKTDS